MDHPPRDPKIGVVNRVSLVRVARLRRGHLPHRARSARVGTRRTEPGRTDCVDDDGLRRARPRHRAERPAHAPHARVGPAGAHRGGREDPGLAGAAHRRVDRDGLPAARCSAPSRSRAGSGSAASDSRWCCSSSSRATSGSGGAGSRAVGGAPRRCRRRRPLSSGRVHLITPDFAECGSRRGLLPSVPHAGRTSRGTTGGAT